jgi:hypothetical protein
MGNVAGPGFRVAGLIFQKKRLTPYVTRYVSRLLFPCTTPLGAVMLSGACDTACAERSIPQSEELITSMVKRVTKWSVAGARFTNVRGNLRESDWSSTWESCRLQVAYCRSNSPISERSISNWTCEECLIMSMGNVAGPGFRVAGLIFQKKRLTPYALRYALCFTAPVSLHDPPRCRHAEWNM